MKKFGRRPGREEPSSTRTGPRARAAQERRFTDPYQHAERPPRPGRPERDERPQRAAVIRLDPDVARVFRDSEAVNETLRLVLRLARLAGGRPPFQRDRQGPGGGGPPRAFARQDHRGPPRPRGPRFEEK